MKHGYNEANNWRANSKIQESLTNLLCDFHGVTIPDHWRSQPAHKNPTLTGPPRMSKPCRPKAAQFFEQSLDVLETNTGLLNAALAISMHALEDIDPETESDRLMAMALRAVGQLHNRRNSETVLTHVHRVLFDEEGFFGNHHNYYLSVNNYVPFVLSSRRGVPVSLCLIYKIVAELAGLRTQGINAPGHFLVRVAVNNNWMIIDPYFGGRTLNRNEAFQRVEDVTGGKIIRSSGRFLPVARNHQWIRRLLSNLQTGFRRQDRQEDIEAMLQLEEMLNERWPYEDDEESSWLQKSSGELSDLQPPSPEG